MQRTTRTTLCLVLAGILSLEGCSGSEDADTPAQSPQAPAEAPAAEVAPPEAAAEPLRSTVPDPEALGVEGALPDDVPVPPGAQALHPPLVASGTTRASFEVNDPIKSVQAFYKARLAESGWSIEAEKELDSQLLMSAKKGTRELSLAMSESAGRTQLVVLLVGE